MIEVLKESRGKTFGIKVSGRLTDEDYEQVLIPHLDRLITRYGRVRILLEVGKNFKGFDARAMLDDVKFGLVERGFHLEKMAVVGGSEWFQWGVRFGFHFIQGEVKFFSAAQCAEAWTWVRKPGRPPTPKHHNFPA